GRCGPEGSQVGTGARFCQGKSGQRLATRQSRKKSLFLLRAPETTNRIDGADAAVYGSETSGHRVHDRHPGQEPGETGEGRALAAVLPFDEHAPVTCFGKLVKMGVGDLSFLIQDFLVIAPPPDDLQALLHGSIAGGRL